MKKEKFKIIKEYGTIAEYQKLDKVVAKVSWYGAEPKYEIRTWDKERKKPGKGVALSYEELLRLQKIVEKESQKLK